MENTNHINSVFLQYNQNNDLYMHICSMAYLSFSKFECDIWNLLNHAPIICPNKILMLVG